MLKFMSRIGAGIDRTLANASSFAGRATTGLVAAEKPKDDEKKKADQVSATAAAKAVTAAAPEPKKLDVPANEQEEIAFVAKTLARGLHAVGKRRRQAVIDSFHVMADEKPETVRDEVVAAAVKLADEMAEKDEKKPDETPATKPESGDPEKDETVKAAAVADLVKALGEAGSKDKRKEAIAAFRKEAESRGRTALWVDQVIGAARAERKAAKAE